MEISIANRQRRIGIRSSRARMIASSVLERETALFDEISIVFLGDREMQRLNRAFTGRDEPTDTLAFELTPEMARHKPVSGVRLGEVIVCADRALIQSKKYRVSVEKELARLLIHGLLHLCGFEDTTNSGRVRMHKRENLYITSLDDEIVSLTASPGKKSKQRRGLPERQPQSEPRRESKSRVPKRRVRKRGRAL